MKKVLLVLMIVLMMVTLGGCKDKEKSKEEDKALNTNLTGKWIVAIKSTSESAFFTINSQFEFGKTAENTYEVIADTSTTSGLGVVAGNTLTITGKDDEGVPFKMTGTIKDGNTIINGKVYDNEVLDNEVSWTAVRGELTISTEEAVGSVQKISEVLKTLNDSIQISMTPKRTAVTQEIKTTINGEGGGTADLNLKMTQDADMVNKIYSIDYSGNYKFTNFKPKAVGGDTINGDIAAKVSVVSSGANIDIATMKKVIADNGTVEMNYSYKTTNLTINGEQYNIDIVYIITVAEGNRTMEMKGTVNGSIVEFRITEQTGNQY